MASAIFLSSFPCSFHSISQFFAQIFEILRLLWISFNFAVVKRFKKNFLKVLDNNIQRYPVQEILVNQMKMKLIQDFAIHDSYHIIKNGNYSNQQKDGYQEKEQLQQEMVIDIFYIHLYI